MKARKYNAEFRRSAVGMVIEQKQPRGAVAKNLGMGVSTLDSWLKEHRSTNGMAHTDEQADLKQRNVELQREVQRLTMERDILKKAAAYFAQANL